MYLAVPCLLVRRSIMLLVSVALVAMTLIGLAGMSASFVVDRSRDSVQAIAVASTLRGHTQRIANLIAIDALKGRIGVSERTRAAMADIERELQQAALRRFVDRPGELFAATYRGVQAGWGAQAAADRGARRACAAGCARGRDAARRGRRLRRSGR